MYQEQIKQLQDRIQTLTDTLHDKESMLALQLAPILNKHLIDGVAQTTTVDGRGLLLTINVSLEDNRGFYVTLDIVYNPKDGLIFYGNVSALAYSSEDVLQVAKVHLASQLIAHEAQMTSLFNGFIKEIAPIKDAYSEANYDLHRLQDKQRAYEQEQIANGLSEGDWYIAKSGYPKKEAFRIVEVDQKTIRAISYATAYSTSKGIYWKVQKQHLWDKKAIAFDIFSGFYIKEALPDELA